MYVPHGKLKTVRFLPKGVQYMVFPLWSARLYLEVVNKQVTEEQNNTLYITYNMSNIVLLLVISISNFVLKLKLQRMLTVTTYKVVNGEL